MHTTATVPEEAITFKALGPVVYFLIDGDECVYVGGTRKLYHRIPQHEKGTRKHPPKTFDSVRYIHVEDSLLRETERFWIKELKPKYNSKSTKNTTVLIKAKVLRPVAIALKAIADHFGTSLSDQISLAVEDQAVAAEQTLRALGAWTKELDEMKKKKRIARGEPNGH